MVKISKFVFNDFQVNTFLLIGNNRDCIVVDPGCHKENEKEQIKNFIAKNNLKPILVLNTHGHVDHVLGINFMKETYKIECAAHKEDLIIFENTIEQGMIFGLDVKTPPKIEKYYNDGEQLEFDNGTLEIAHVPGHSPGSIAIIGRKDKFAIVGDVLFNGSIGRTDLYKGDYKTLIDSINNKLMVLDDDFVVYPGHGPETTIGNERNTNPFLI